MENLDFGIIGNCNSAALVSKKGSIDWLCLPCFDSPSIFAKILDKKIGGSFEINVDNDYVIKQAYIPRTNILVTDFKSGENHFKVYDFMPRYKYENGTAYSPPDIIRFIKKINGRPVFSVTYNPRLEYAKPVTQSEIRKQYIKSYTKKGDYDSVYLYTNLDKELVLSGQEIEITDDAFFLMSYNQKILHQNLERITLKFERTKVYWLNWSERTHLYRRYNNEILRSALILKLLSYSKSGAVLAALTTSIPETIGEIRNWDYRYCWIRDASMVIKIMAETGHNTVAHNFMRFIIDAVPEKDEKLQIMYGIRGQRQLPETILSHLEGYENSKPVRIGNAAFKQKQNDIFGILMDVIYQQFRLFESSLDNSEALWTIIRSIVKKVEKNWQKPDRGIWEIRTGQKHFTFSKVLCWVAIDRAIKIARLINMKDYEVKWKKIEQKIKADIHKNAWNEELQSFTQSYGSSDFDASILLMEPYGFIDASDPRYIATVQATHKELSRNGLMYRYKNHDDFGSPSSSFTICTFWVIQALYKIGEKEQAGKIFDTLLSHSNHLGLFSEDIDFETKRLLGNFPQAYSHLALIETAILFSDGDMSDENKVLQVVN